MTNAIQTQSTDKAEWTVPELVELDSDLYDVENGFNVGTDGVGPTGISSS